MRAAVLRYRVMAYVTGVVLVILCFVGIPLQVFAHNEAVVNYVGTTHGILYAPTVLLLLAGTIPVLTFVVERWMTRRYINPALEAAESAAAPAAAPAQPQSR